jgi:hypothetical protein
MMATQTAEDFVFMSLKKTLIGFAALALWRH